MVELHLPAGLGDKKKDEDRNMPLKAKVRKEIHFGQDDG